MCHREVGWRVLSNESRSRRLKPNLVDIVHLHRVLELGTFFFIIVSWFFLVFFDCKKIVSFPFNYSDTNRSSKRRSN